MGIFLYYNSTMKEYTKEDLMNEVNVTDKYVAFWGSVFSNFYPCKIYHHGIDFKSSEQLFMYYKAMFFGDDETVRKIVKANTPKEAKALGRQVKDYNDEAWSEVRELMMKDAVTKKFEQNPELQKFLLDPDFKDKHFVEGSPVDGIWGAKVDWKDPRIADEKNWNGLNLLGVTLDKVRNELLREKDA